MLLKKDTLFSLGPASNRPNRTVTLPKYRRTNNNPAAAPAVCGMRASPSRKLVQRRWGLCPSMLLLTATMAWLVAVVVLAVPKNMSWKEQRRQEQEQVQQQQQQQQQSEERRKDATDNHMQNQDMNLERERRNVVESPPLLVSSVAPSQITLSNSPTTSSPTPPPTLSQTPSPIPLITSQPKIPKPKSTPTIKSTTMPPPFNNPTGREKSKQSRKPSSPRRPRRIIWVEPPVNFTLNSTKGRHMLPITAPIISPPSPFRIVLINMWIGVQPPTKNFILAANSFAKQSHTSTQHGEFELDVALILDQGVILPTIPIDQLRLSSHIKLYYYNTVSQTILTRLQTLLPLTGSMTPPANGISGQKVSDLRWLLADLFPEIIQGYYSWGWFDAHSLSGNLFGSLTRFGQDFLESDVVSSLEFVRPYFHTSGSFAVIRNDVRLNTLYRTIPDIERKIFSTEVFAMDEMDGSRAAMNETSGISMLFIDSSMSLSGTQHHVPHFVNSDSWRLFARRNELLINLAGLNGNPLQNLQTHWNAHVTRCPPQVLFPKPYPIQLIHGQSITFPVERKQMRYGRYFKTREGYWWFQCHDPSLTYVLVVGDSPANGAEFLLTMLVAHVKQWSAIPSSLLVFGDDSR